MLFTKIRAASLTLAFTTAILVSGLAAEKELDALFAETRQALKADQAKKALASADKAAKLAPTNSEAFFLRGLAQEQDGNLRAAIENYDRSIQLEPTAPSSYQQRGVAHFKSGNFADSIRDFDTFISSVPQRAADHWQRGISCYYAGEFEKGRKQFELHQTVNPNDVENAVWHYLCVARKEGVMKARTLLLPVGDDHRIPMKQIYALFAGKASLDDVLDAAKGGSPSPEALKQRLFYAHLYLALHAEAAGETKRVREHLEQSLTNAPRENYMADVARVHFARLVASKR